jgi:membrane protein
MNRYLRTLSMTQPVRWGLRQSRRIIVPGMDGLPLYDVAVFFIRGLRMGAINMRASSLSFSFFLALFPGVIFFFTLLPYIPIHDLNEQVMALLATLLPENATEAVRDTIEDITTKKRGGLLSVGFVFALYFSTSGITSIIQAFNQTYHTIDPRKIVVQRLIAIALVIILSILVISAIALMTLGSVTIDLLQEYHIIKGLYEIQMLILLKWAAISLMIFFGISFLYFLAPARKSRFRFFSAGSTLATLGTLGTCLLFNWYINNFTRYNALYGSIATLIILLLWIYFNANILLIGFELNASIQSAKNSHLVSSDEAGAS